MIRATYTDRSAAAVEEFRRRFGPVLVRAAGEVRDTVVEYIEDAPPRTGRPRRNARSGETERSSAPGEPPAEGTGAYIDSWDYSREARSDGSRLIASAGSDMQSDAGIPLGADLEHGVTVDARPHVGPAMNEAGARIRDVLDGAR
jgi:hypothetical protein